MANNLPPRLCETTDRLTVLLFCDIHIEIGMTCTTVPVCWLLDVEPYNADTSLALLAHIVDLCKSYVIELLSQYTVYWEFCALWLTPHSQKNYSVKLISS